MKEPIPPKARIVNETHPLLLVVLLILVAWLVSIIYIGVKMLQVIKGV